MEKGKNILKLFFTAFFSAGLISLEVKAKNERNVMGRKKYFWVSNDEKLVI